MTDKTNLPQKTQGVSLPAVIEERYVVVDLMSEEDFSITRALTAKTMTEILAPPESVPLDEMTGKPFQLMGIDFFAKSQIPDAKTPYYVYLNCQDQEGRSFSGTTGSAFCMSRAIGLDSEGMLPAWVMTVKVPSKSKPGQESLWLVEANRKFVTKDGEIIETTAEANVS